ncbi:tyrosine-type recombinase/integrase [Kineococcus glutinatus]|uniref:Site-specific integrase n=1 Tax=Kineococcus glutinatus TaxID=1070872 RepID=A0ABP9I4M4_9ACTN
MSDSQLDLYGRTAAELAVVDVGPVPPPAALDTETLRGWLDGLPAALRSGRSATTWRAYATDLAHFAAWCGAEGRTALPAEADTVVGYLLAHSEELSLATLQRRLAAVSVAHRLLGHPSPTATERVRLTWAGIRRTLGPVARRRRVEAIDTPVLSTLVAPLGDSVLDHRDRALLVMGFAGALRRSELSGLDAEDVDVQPDGLHVHVPGLPSEETGHGRTVVLPHGSRRATCPVRSWQAWVQVSGVRSGPAFLAVTKGGRSLRQQRLTGQAIARMIKRRVLDVGLDPDAFSGHSLRAGFATAAAGAGLPDRSIRRQTGHRSSLALEACIRGPAPVLDNPAAYVGL